SSPSPSPCVPGPRPPYRGWTACAWRAGGAGRLSCRSASRSQKCAGRRCLTLPLLVPRVVADHHDPAVSADHLALLADLLDARLHLHVCRISGSSLRDAAGGGAEPCPSGRGRPERVLTCLRRRSDSGRGHRATAPPPPGPPRGS